MQSLISITASYAFVSLDTARTESLRRDLIEFGKAHGLLGLVLIAPEGINSTVSGSADGIAAWKAQLQSLFGDVRFKDSSAEKAVFRRWSVKLKPEIVGIKNAAIRPAGKHRHLSPEEWQAALVEEDVVIIDARNSYEYAIGKFKNAIDPGTKKFHEFPAAVAKAGIPKDKKVLMYCTGGIRCEKAIYAMEEQGYDNVYQLDGGILGYLEKFPHANFEGECFVFDHRVAVDQDLRPSRIYDLCPHCGDPGSTDITCACGKSQKICAACEPHLERRTCSKRCANERAMVSR